jgi:hypothetical protein
MKQKCYTVDHELCFVVFIVIVVIIVLIVNKIDFYLNKFGVQHFLRREGSRYFINVGDLSSFRRICFLSLVEVAGKLLSVK